VAQAHVNRGTGAHQLWHWCTSTVEQVLINCGMGVHQLWHGCTSTVAQMRINFMFVIEDLLENGIKY
jgi:hypothetical protein